MTFGAQLQLGGGSGSYTVTLHGGCTIVTGSLPISHLAALAQAGGKGEIMSPHLARLAGANHAWGPADAVAALVKELASQRERGLPASGVERWLAVGEHGASSLAIVQNLTGRKVTDEPKAHPHDDDDLSRCVALLEMAPELRSNFWQMATVSRVWMALVSHWEKLEALLRNGRTGDVNLFLHAILREFD